MRTTGLLLSLPVLSQATACGVLGDPPMSREEFDEVGRDCPLAGASFAEGSAFFGTPSVIRIDDPRQVEATRRCVFDLVSGDGVTRSRVRFEVRAAD